MRSSRARLLVLALALLAVLGPATADTAPAHAAVQGAGRTADMGGFVPEWSWPLDPVPRVLRAFDKPAQDWKPGHRGVDLSVDTGAGSEILGPADGVVSFAGRVVDRGVVSIDHGGGRVSSLEPVVPGVRKGDRVTEGQVVAVLEPPGPSGSHCPASCLHWGVRVDGEYVDPLGFVLDRRPSVLLPL